MHPIGRRLTLSMITLLLAAGTARAGDVYAQTNLVSNISGMAQQTDANLRNPWGVSFSTGSPFWISDQAANVSGSGAAGVYGVSNGTTSTNALLTVAIPNDGGAPPALTNGPTGQVNTSAPGITTAATDFVVGATKAAFIFSNMDGSISGWNGGAHSTIEVPAVTGGPSYTGLAIGNPSAGVAQLYAADQNSGNIDVYNSKWALTGHLTDPGGLPAGFTAFNVQNLGGTLFVTFANQATTGGIVDEFKTDGTFIKRLVNDPAGAHLNAPWGLAIAPAAWGTFSGDLLVGNNNGPGWINAYDLNSGMWKGTLMLNNGQLFAEPDLWALSFGNGGGAGHTDILYFTAGLSSNVDGLFGAISVPEPSSAVLGLIAVGVLTGGWHWKNRRRSVTA
jgi:uncharacterized protein (TIGR03118 family)